MADPTLAQFLQRPAAQQEMLGAEPTEEYMRSMRNRAYDDAMVHGLGAGMGAGLTGMMAFPGPGGMVGRTVSRFAGAPLAAIATSGAAMRGADGAARARAYQEAIRRGVDPTLIPDFQQQPD